MLLKTRKKAKAETLTKSKDVRGFLDELRVEGDRAAAIVGAAFLDEQLRQLLTNYLVDDGEKVGSFLSRELVSFGARIRAAYCMGLIAKEYFEALKIVQDIRNAFAHQLHGLSFGDSDMVKVCKRLQELMPIKPRITPTPRKMFESVIMIISIDITGKVFTVKRCKTPIAPSVPKELSV